MLSTPKFTRTQFCTRNFFPSLPCGPEKPAAAGPDSVERALNYGRLARSHEHSPGVAVPGSESGHAVQVRRGTENPCLQVGQPLALQEIEAGPVDGREVEPDGSGNQAETEGSYESCRGTVIQVPVDAGTTKGGHMFGFGSKSIVGLDVGSSSIKAVELKK